MTNLFMVAHVDDAEISCAGLIQKLRSKCDHVKVISLSHVYSNISLLDEFIHSMNLLDAEYRTYNVETRRFNANQNYISDIIYDMVKGYDNVYTHDCSDRHDDHRVVAEQVRRLYNGNLYTFITPLNGNECPNYFAELLEAQLENKIEALACYKSQAHRAYMNPDFIRAQARYNGIKCGKLYAEGFKVERLIT